jgi:hypothetical protein
MDRESLLAQFEILLPLAVAWAAEQEDKILSEGLPLLEPERADAGAIGVKEPERVRLLPVETIPRPSQPQLRAACDSIDFLTPATRGLTLRYGIFVRSDCWRDRSLIIHELVHTAQYERLEGIHAFLERYLFECVTIGYPEAPLEQEAIAVAARLSAG